MLNCKHTSAVGVSDFFLFFETLFLTGFLTNTLAKINLALVSGSALRSTGSSLLPGSMGGPFVSPKNKNWVNMCSRPWSTAKQWFMSRHTEGEFNQNLVNSTYFIWKIHDDKEVYNFRNRGQGLTPRSLAPSQTKVPFGQHLSWKCPRLFDKVSLSCKNSVQKKDLHKIFIQNIQ